MTFEGAHSAMAPNGHPVGLAKEHSRCGPTPEGEPEPSRARDGEERIAFAYDGAADEYDDFYSGPSFQAENEVVGRWLAPRVAGRTVLDVGCGTGLLLELCPGISSQSYLGIDTSPRMLEVARRKHPGYCFEMGNMCGLSRIEDAAFSSVVSLWSFQYATRPTRAVNEFRRVLQPHGCLSLLTNTPKHLRRKSYLHKGAGLPQIKWSATALKRLCRHFEEVQVWGLNAFADGLSVFPARWIARYLRWESRVLSSIATDCFLYIALAASKPGRGRPELSSRAALRPVTAMGGGGVDEPIGRQAEDSRDPGEST